MGCGAEHNCRQQIEGASPGDACHVPEGDHSGTNVIDLGTGCGQRWGHIIPFIQCNAPFRINKIGGASMNARSIKREKEVSGRIIESNVSNQED